VLSPYSYFTVIGSARTANLDTGWANWFADYAHPADFFESLLSGSKIVPFYNGNFAHADVPTLNAKITALGSAQLGPAQERQYANLDRRYMKLAPWAPYGTRTLSTFVSQAVDLRGLVWNPLFGIDLASLRFGNRR
jgi:peptide/nickel transport system substrate-binding protein